MKAIRQIRKKIVLVNMTWNTNKDACKKVNRLIWRNPINGLYESVKISDSMDNDINTLKTEASGHQMAMYCVIIHN